MGIYCISMYVQGNTFTYSTPRKQFVAPVPANSQVSSYAQVSGQFRVSRLAQTPVMHVICADPVDPFRLTSPYDVSLSKVLQHTYRAVGAVESSDGLHRGTAFLLATNVAMVSRHTLEGQDIRQASIRMGMLRQRGCAIGQSYPITGIIEDNPQLDYMIVRLQGAPGLRYAWLQLSTQLPDTALALLHHPLGKDLQVSVHTTVQSSDCSTGCTPFHDTDNGSSGAPYIAPNGTCVALHLGTEKNHLDPYLYRVALPIQNIVTQAPQGFVAGLLRGHFPPNHMYVGPLIVGNVVPVRHPFVDTELSLFRLSGSKQVSQFLDLWRNRLNQQEINLDRAEKRTSREASHGVYLLDQKVYKVYTSPSGPEQAIHNGGVADSVGIPVPELKMFEAMLGENPQSSHKVYVLQMSRVAGRFFQLSKTEGVLSAAILGLEDWGKCVKMARILKAAGDAGLTDPQGFVSPNAANPICFIDIHFGGTPNGRLIDMAKLAVARARMIRNALPDDLMSLCR